ncbi:MAG: hypothetical protein WCL18_01165 [bacterium]
MVNSQVSPSVPVMDTISAVNNVIENQALIVSELGSESLMPSTLATITSQVLVSDVSPYVLKNPSIESLIPSTLDTIPSHVLLSDMSQYILKNPSIDVPPLPDLCLGVADSE